LPRFCDITSKPTQNVSSFNLLETKMTRINELIKKTEAQHRIEFYDAPNETLFDQICIAVILGCSEYKLERDRWAGTGVPFLKIGRKVKYRKADVLTWLGQFQPQKSTSETKNQAT
jgi:hypothetical protein